MKKLFLLLAFFSFSISFAQDPEGMALVKNFEKVEVKEDFNPTINHEIIRDVLQEFKQSVEFKPIRYQEVLRPLNSVRFVKGDISFRTAINGDDITLNSIYTEFPNLARVMILQALGEYMGIPKVEDGWDIMSNKWVINPQHEGKAYLLRQHHAQKTRFINALQEKHPLTYKL